MKALVMSGGGSKGAFAGGVAEFLIGERKKQYDILIGTSTGSLMIPLLAIGEIEKLRKTYTTVRTKDIFSISPFVVTKKNGVYRTSINHLGILRMFLKGGKTFGDSGQLRKLISSVITRDDFRKMQLSNTEIVVAVSNLSCNTVEYKSMKNCSYEDFCDWIWISSNLVPFMSLVTKNGYEYADGGIGVPVPIQEAIRRGASEIDVILLSPKIVSNGEDTGNAFSLTWKLFNFMLHQIKDDSITIAKLEGMQQAVHLHFYYPPRILTEHPLVFDPKEMTAWWEEGFEYAKANTPLDCPRRNGSLRSRWNALCSRWGWK